MKVRIILNSLGLLGLISSSALAEITFVSASNPNANYLSKMSEVGNEVFLINGLQGDESTELQFSITGDCPFMAIAAGSKFESALTCESGVVTASITNKGGMGWNGEEIYNGALWIGFSSMTDEQKSQVPANFGMSRISVYGDIYGFNTNFIRGASGTSFEVEFSGDPEGSAHFLMDLSSGMVKFLGGVLGLNVQGKPNPFATVKNNDDASATLQLDLAKLKAAAVTKLAANSVTKKISAGERKLSVASNSASAKAGSTVSLAACAGKTFTNKAKVPVSFTLGGKSNKLLKATYFTLDQFGCARKSLKLPKNISGTLGAQISYLGKSAKMSVKITK